MKKGTLVKMTKEGFAFHHNPDRVFDAYCLRDVITYKHYSESFCETLAIMGTGKVLFSKTVEGETIHKVKWELKHNGMYFYYTMWYDLKDIRKLSLLERIKEFLC